MERRSSNRRRGDTQDCAERRIVEQPADRLLELVDVTRLDEEAVDAVADNLADAARVGADEWLAVHHRLDHDEAE